ncbi:hypothetical protein LMG28138_02432 [Pararobbsia alpina]|uniref:Uncharacterized protein n=2 Tax=Pararobbsia alpina TaxID=621374 RepID=A0A6S7BG08_9BURK|nr:hypothetical protein LMG28138_02432 [Pararobbsia alpina]
MKLIRVIRQRDYRHYCVAILSCTFLLGCGDGSTKQATSAAPPVTAASAPAVAAPANAVTVTTNSPGPIAASVGGNTSVTVTFDTTDGQPATSLAVTTGLSSLPDGWSTMTPSFACPSVSNGNGCQLSLRYMPVAAATSQVLTLGFAYIDSSGAQRMGTVDLTFSATLANTAVATVTPTGTIQALVGTTNPVGVSFATSDGTPATNLNIASGLSSLPPGWSVDTSSLPCASLTTGTSCQLGLSYAPTAARPSSTLTLGYSYTNNAGQAEAGTVNIPYIAMAPSTVVATPTPAGPVSAFVGANALVTVAFNSSDGSTDTNLRITSALPVGWSQVSSTLPCAAVVANGACTLALTYTPTVTTASSNLVLQYAYTDNSGQPQTSSLTIAYSANSHFAFISNVFANTVSQCEVGVAGQLVDCTPQTSSLFSLPTGMNISSGRLYVTGNPSGTVNKCSLDSTGLSGCTSTGNGMSSPIGLAIKGSTAYVSDQASGTIFQCSIDLTGDLTGCTGLPVSGGFIGQVAVNGSTLYVFPVNQTSILRCAIGASGLVSACVTDSAPAILDAVVFNGAFAYATTANNTVLQCRVDNSTGMLTGCVDSGAGAIFNQPIAMTIFGGFAYVVNRGNNTVTQCTVGANGGLSNCVDSGANGLNSPFGIALQ